MSVSGWLELIAQGGFRDIFYGRGGVVFLQGVLRKVVCRTWCFDGENVVECVVKRGVFMVVFSRRKTGTSLKVFSSCAKLLFSCLT
jgi:hypothetical protein